MSDLYVANCTKQNYDLCYRLVRAHKSTGELEILPKLHMETIPPGQQLRVAGGDLTAEDIAHIIEDHAPYGLVNANEVGSLSTFIGRCYSIDKPVPLDNILYVVEQNDDVMNRHAEQRREKAAAAFAQRNQEESAERGFNLKRTEVETEEATRGEKSINEGFEIPVDGVAPRHSQLRAVP